MRKPTQAAVLLLLAGPAAARHAAYPGHARRPADFALRQSR